jgi:YegS/Rv2252/BmrU family lipid kinase
MSNSDTYYHEQLSNHENHSKNHENHSNNHEHRSSNHEHHCGNTNLFSILAKKLHIPTSSSSEHNKSIWSSSESEEELIEVTSSEIPLDDYQEDIEKYEKEGKFPESIALPSNGKICKVNRVLLLYNPYSGAERGKVIAKKATQLLSEANVSVDLYKLERSGHAQEIVEQEDLSAYDCLCIVGGDGTFHEAINGLMRRPEHQRKIPLAIIPAGTGNSFTLELYGRTDVHKAVKHVLRGLCCPIDVTRVHYSEDKEDIYSVNSIHWGLASAVNVRAEKLRWMHSGLRYTTAIFFEFMKGAKTRAKMEFVLQDGTKKEYDDEFCLLISNNIMSAKKGMRMAPEAKLNDGLIDVVLIRSSNAFHLVNAFAKTYEGTHTELEYVEYLQVKSFSVRPYMKVEVDGIEKKVDVQEEIEEIIDIDGELVGHTPFTATVLQQVINIII